MEVQLPKSIKILGKSVKIKVMDLEGDMGQFKSDKMTIYIDPEQSDAEAKATLFHEMIHAALFVSGISFLFNADMEEALVRALEHALTPLINFKF